MKPLKEKDVCLAYGLPHPHNSILWTGNTTASSLRASRHHHQEIPSSTLPFGFSPAPGPPLATTSSASVFVSELTGASPSASSRPGRCHLPALGQPRPEVGAPGKAGRTEASGGVPFEQLNSSFSAQDLRKLLKMGSRVDGGESKHDRSKAETGMTKSVSCKEIGPAIRAGRLAKERERQSCQQSRCLPPLTDPDARKDNQVPEIEQLALVAEEASTSKPYRRESDQVLLPPVHSESVRRPSVKARGSSPRLKEAEDGTSGAVEAEGDRGVARGVPPNIEVQAMTSTRRDTFQKSTAAMNTPASTKKRQKKKGDSDEDIGIIEARAKLQRHQWLVQHPEYMDSRIAYLRRGKVHTKWRMEVFDNDNLWENKCLFSTYAMGLRRRRDKRKAADGARNLSPQDTAETLKRDAKSQQQSGGGKKKNDVTSGAADHTKQIMTLHKDLKVSTRNLEVAIDPEKEAEEEAEEKEAAAQHASFLADLQASFRRKVGDAAPTEAAE
eukprot:CAMPEP_0178420186 /NCGR_PEP_ID=MMETSP0689_2-20121128/25999_1 /TAXON_ID=160604 /ORGANISM="Amphidinium massartii, Strain CS-259" /LENGTH=497 /DNA_ID=CAMNT_0020041653 /DNA_START=35 /DNA_END=1528 /DNA_ORIENTATION=+